MSGNGWQQIAAPGSGRDWIRTERVEGGWLLVIEIERPDGGARRMAAYGPVASLGRAEGLRLDLLRDLASVPHGDVPGVLCGFGGPALTRRVAPFVAAMAAERRTR